MGTHGCIKLSEDREYFKKGLAELVKRLTPKTILVYGRAPDSIFKPYRDMGIEIIAFESEFSKSAKAGDCLMGGSVGGNFGNTKGISKLSLEEISDILTLLSLVPGLDTFADFAAMFVDLERGDLESAALDAFGVIPFIGEIADASKTAKFIDKATDAAKVANKSYDAVKTAKKVTSFSDFPKKIHIGKQGKHIVGHNNYKKGKSILNISTETAQTLVNKYSGTGRKIGANRERINFKRIIGKYVDPKTGKSYYTTVGTIHYSKSGAHIVPEKPINWRK